MLVNIPDNYPLYKIKKYRMSLELINDNVPLNIVKRRLHAKTLIEVSNKTVKKESKKINRKCVIIDSELQKRATKVVIIDPSSDYICDKCTYKPNHHPYGCKLKLK
jgi:hypothetical protein